MLPFANLSGDPEQDYFADGIVEDIITALSRAHWLFVIARNSSFTYKGKVRRTYGLEALCYQYQRARGRMSPSESVPAEAIHMARQAGSLRKDDPGAADGWARAGPAEWRSQRRYRAHGILLCATQ